MSSSAAAAQKTVDVPQPTQVVRKTGKGTTSFTDADAHLYFWFPLLAGLSELTFDTRRDVRHSALEVGLAQKFILRLLGRESLSRCCSVVPSRSE